MSVLLNRGHCGFRTLCWLMTWLMAASPSLPVFAQQLRVKQSEPYLLADPDYRTPEPLKLRYIVPAATFAIAARPHQLLTSKAATLLPVEVVTAAGLKELGFDPVQVTQVVISMTPPIAGPPLYAAAVTVVEPIDLFALSPKLIGHTEPAELNGKAYLKSHLPFLPSIIWADEHTLLIAPDATLQQLFTQEKPSASTIVEKFTELESTDDLLAVVDLQPLRALIQMGLMEATQKMPPEGRPFLAIPNLLKTVQLRLNLSGAGPWELVAQANSTADAEKISDLIELAINMYSDEWTKSAERFLNSDDPVEQAFGRYQLRVAPMFAEQGVPLRDGDSFTLFHMDLNDERSGLTSVAIIGVLVALLLPAVQAAREAARRNSSLNNMKQIMLTLLNYESAYGNFPAHSSFDESGKPLLSWRVHVLPFLEQQALYDQFHLDEPWDSEHNRQLIPQMPEVYNDPSSRHDIAEGKTSYLGAFGEGYLFNGTKEGTNVTEIRDGLSNTIAILQVDDSRATPWTKPDDWQLDEENPLAGLSGPHPGIFMAGFADGHVKSISQQIDHGVFKAMLTIVGGEVIPANP